MLRASLCAAVLSALLVTPLHAALASIPDKLVVLTFDDSSASHYTVARPVLKRYGFRATFFITEGFTFRTNKRDYMTWEQIAELHREGFEIGNHSRDHLSITEKKVGRLAEQLATIAARCREHGIPEPTSFAWPGNKFHVDALPVLQKAGIRFARRGGEPEIPYQQGGGVAYEPGIDHPLLIPTAGDARPSWTLEHLQRAVAKARDGRIAVLQFHGVPDGEHPWVNTPQERFEEYMAWLHREGFKLIALRDLARYVDADLAPSDPLEIMERRKKSLAAPLYGEAPGPHEVTSYELALPDPSGDKPLPLRIYAPRTAGGPFPVILFSHGLGGSKEGFRYLSRHWASHGYVCVHATHNDARAIAANPGFGAKAQRVNTGRTATRVPDLKLILDSLDTLAQLQPALRGKLDPQRIGAAGHSAGAFPVQVLGGARVSREGSKAFMQRADPRVKAIMPISSRGIGRGGFAAESWTDLRLPVLWMTGARDDVDGYFGDQSVERRMDGFRHARPGDKYLLFIEAANHSSFGGTLRTSGGPALTAEELATVKRYVQVASTAFWDAYLKNNDAARAFLKSSQLDETAAGAARLEKK